MKTSLKYQLLSLLILFTVINTAVAVPNRAQTEPSAQTEQNLLPGTIDDGAIPNNLTETNFCFTNTLLTNPQVVQTGGNLVGKRIQVDKDLLLLHATKYSKAVKASAGDHIKYADSLTHISLLLFPYHFFW